MYCKCCQLRITRTALQLLRSPFALRSYSSTRYTARGKSNCRVGCGASKRLSMALSEKVLSFKRAFDVFDHDQKGEINFIDFPTAVRSLGFNPTNSQVTEVLKAANKEENDKINFAEFSDMMGKFEGCRKEDAEEALREAFKKFDRDGNGYISPDELLYVVCNSGEKLSREEAEELIGMFDKNADGQLSWEEFVEFFKCDREAPDASMTIPEEDCTEEDSQS